MLSINNFANLDITAELCQDQGRFVISFKAEDGSGTSLVLSYPQLKVLVKSLAAMANQVTIGELWDCSQDSGNGGMAVNFILPEEGEGQPDIPLAQAKTKYLPKTA
jgi:hypothetical protein